MKQRRPFLLLLLAILSSALAACGGSDATPSAADELSQETRTIEVDGGSYTDVSVDGLALMLEDKDFPLINVHIPYEGEIEGTDSNIPFDEIDQHLDQLPEDKDARIVLYCRSDNMSNTAARELVQLGYTDVWNVDGGMNAWTESGRTLINR